MSKNVANYLSLIFVALVGLFFFVQSKSLMNNYSEDTLGPGYLPFWLSIILFVLCFISFIKTFNKKDAGKFIIPQQRFIVLTAIIIALFCFSWSLFGYFYIHSFLFVLILLTLYRSALGWTIKNVGLNTAIAFGFVVFVYVLFEIIVKVSL